MSECCTATIQQMRETIPFLIYYVSPFIVDFPVLEQWSESASLSEASLFMDGFLYISTGASKTTLERRGRDGERLKRKKRVKRFIFKPPAWPINSFVSSLNCVFVRGLLQLSAERSISVSLSAVKLPIV